MEEQCDENCLCEGVNSSLLIAFMCTRIIEQSNAKLLINKACIANQSEFVLDTRISDVKMHWYQKR
jgi:hypothetical protein